MLPFKGLILLKSFTSSHSNSLLTSVDYYTLLKSKFFATVPFLPPYSPDLNPIEHVWSPLKNRVRMKLDQDEINLETALSQG
ncbi:transposase [Piscirickettsia salmonis]|uniref:transposase n=1 Tax=Piscirickettsia salmonis TaxID=1238 RepID=UPI001E389B33|nr:transposase [Piscirickettsia salmonis]